MPELHCVSKGTRITRVAPGPNDTINAQSNIMKKLPLILTALAASATLALAADESPAPGGHGGKGGPGGPGGPGGARPSPEEMFKKLDTNTDGKLSLKEYKASPMAQKNPDKAAERFKKLDTNGDSFLSLEEFKAGRPGPGGPGKGGAEKPAATP